MWYCQNEWNEKNSKDYKVGYMSRDKNHTFIKLNTKE